MQETQPRPPVPPRPCPSTDQMIFLFIKLCPFTGIWEPGALQLCHVHGFSWLGLAGSLSESLRYKFLVFPRSKRQILDVPKPSSSQSLLCCFHLMSQSLYSSKLPQPEMSLMDPVPSAREINAWTALWWFCAAGDGCNSSCAASAHASSSFALKCLFLLCLEGRWMLLGAGAESREEAACSQSPGSFSGNACPGHAAFSCWDTRNTKLFYFLFSIFYFLLTFPSSGEPQLGKRGPASIRSTIHEQIPLLVGRLQQVPRLNSCRAEEPRGRAGGTAGLTPHHCLSVCALCTAAPGMISCPADVDFLSLLET